MAKLYDWTVEELANDQVRTEDVTANLDFNYHLHSWISNAGTRSKTWSLDIKMISQSQAIDDFTNGLQIRVVPHLLS